MKRREDGKVAGSCDEASDGTSEIVLTVVTALTVIAVVTLCTLAHAGDGDARSAVKSDEPECRIVKMPNGKKEVRCGPMTIEGRRQVPMVLVIPRAEVVFSERELDERMTPKVVEAVKKPPFGSDK